MKHKRFYDPGEVLGVEVHRGKQTCFLVHDGSHVITSMVGKSLSLCEMKSTLERLIAEKVPKRVFVDNGGDFISKSLASHISQKGIPVASRSPYCARTTPGERYVRRFNVTGKRGEHDR
jgi:hypothetical protein